MRVFLVVAIVASLMAPGTARADSWLPPTEKTYLAPDGSARVIVTPRGIESPLAYFEDKIAGTEPAGQRAGASERAVATLELASADGSWQRVWSRPLVNETAPVEVLVAPRGERLVTLDNWHSVGYGDDVVVIYDERGALLRKYALTELVGRELFDAFPRSVSSIWWSETATLSADGRRVLIPLSVPTGMIAPAARGADNLIALDLADATPAIATADDQRHFREVTDAHEAAAEAMAAARDAATQAAEDARRREADTR